MVEDKTELPAHQAKCSTRGVLYRIERERRGIPAAEAEKLRCAMGLSAQAFAHALGIKPTTYRARTAKQSLFVREHSYAIGDLEDLIEKADKLLPSSMKGFDTPRWFASWMEQPQPALGNLSSADLLDTPTGRNLVARLIGAIGSGVYL